VSAPPSADDPSILDKDVLLRRIYHAGRDHPVEFVVTDSITRKRVPTSAGFRAEDDGLSVYLVRLLQDAGLGPESVVTEPMNAVAAVEAGVIRFNGLGVVCDPNPPDVPDPDHPRHDAHCLIKGWDGRSRGQIRKLRRALAAASTLIVDPGAP
jgi:hypothetical protein